MENGDEVSIPIYIISGNSMIATGSATLQLVGNVILVGDFSFYAPKKKPWDVDSAKFNLNIIHDVGRDTVRTSLGAVDFKRDGNLLLALTQFDWTPELDSAMADPRSITN